jgi:hypothetical protein
MTKLVAAVFVVMALQACDRSGPADKRDADVLQGDQLSAAEYEALPDDRAIQVNGMITTKRAIRGLQESVRARLARRLEQRQDDFESADRARRDTKNARTQADLARLLARADNPAHAEALRALGRDAQAVVAQGDAGGEEAEGRAGALLQRYYELTR